MINSVILMGRLTADPELKKTPSDVSVTTFTVAVDRAYAKQGEEKKTDFINVVSWRQTAEFICKYFKKGQMIAVQGSIQTRNYEDKEGHKRTAFEIMAEHVSFCGDKKTTESETQTATDISSDNSLFDAGLDLPF